MSRFLLAVLLLAGLPAPAHASLKLADSFRIGSTGVLCTAQSRVADPQLATMFDRGYRIVCRDAASPVGRLLALRGGAERAAVLLAPRSDGVVCEAAGAADIAELPGARLARCRQGDLAWSVYTVLRGNTLYAAEGLTGYGAALRLGLGALVADAPVNGAVDVAATEAGDPAAFARVQAGSLDPGQALAEGYIRNNAGSYAEASEFFDLLIERSRLNSPGFDRSAEYLANQALQQSNLGSFAEADALFVRAGRALDPADPVATRLHRNFRTLHELNRRRPDAARVELARIAVADTSGLATDRVAAGYIDVPLAQKLNSDEKALKGMAGGDARLDPADRVVVLDAQAQYLAAAADRMQGRDAAARRGLAAAAAQLDRLRLARVSSAGWLRAAIATERAIIEEREGQGTAARASLAAATIIYRTEYPGTAAALVAEARLAALLARQGDTTAARALYARVIAASPETPGAGQAVRGLVDPYFALLVGTGDSAASDFFGASQILVRPGVAQTQAILARELSGGSDEAAGLFRQSITLSRDIVRVEGDIARIAAKTEADPDDAATVATLRARREALGRDQTAVLSRLADYPRYRSLSNATVTLRDLQAKLRPGEAYYKLVLAGDDAYGLFAGTDTARIFRVGAGTGAIGAMVARLRETIVTFENGRAATYPFDAATARQLYRVLFDPVAAAMPAVTHLVFEPDGPLLQLPPNLLIAGDDGLAAYAARVDDPAADAFDMRGLAWLGRGRMVSTAVSPRAFLEVRGVAASRGGRSYLGLGENAVPTAPITARDACDWSLREWGNPISAAELRIGAALLARGGSDVVTGGSFSDTGLMARTDLRSYRVIHFATHGLVTAPRLECPARPALLTSFGAGASDGLLSFREIFDLGLDADTIILSACDTAGTATASATRDAGIATGGNYALDGLVRAFVGAGARAVVASHWPVPDNYDATRTLISGLFSDAGRISVGEALRASQVRLMDRAETSHPYYWSGFAIVGDAAKPLIGAVPGASAPAGR
ncbi:CHAT domain-containing protein [Sandarakinorhabdus sp. DWP1-3-1]|uniref:CHAT domain-containing protein n=1 Tax=Sandarakinorhabdus sp. DWP1-3-1 TaxID=2804627 RepID=UPI003CF613AD